MPGGTTPAQVAERFKADKQIFADAVKGHGGSSRNSDRGRPELGLLPPEFDYVMKIHVDYVTNLLYKIPILAQEGTSPETTCRRSQEWRPATVARNRTAGGPDPDRQAVRPGAGSRCGSGVPLPETPAWVRGRKSPRWSAERGPGRTGTGPRLTSAGVAPRTRDKKKERVRLSALHSPSSGVAEQRTRRRTPKGAAGNERCCSKGSEKGLFEEIDRTE